MNSRPEGVNTPSHWTGRRRTRYYTGTSLNNTGTALTPHSSIWEWSANTPQRLTARPQNQWESPTHHMTVSWTQNRNSATIRIGGSNFWRTDIVPVGRFRFHFYRKYSRLRRFRFRCFRIDLRHIRPASSSSAEEEYKHLQVRRSGSFISRCGMPPSK